MPLGAMHMAENAVQSLLSGIWKMLQIIGVIVIVAFVYGYFAGPSSSGLALGNLSSGGGGVSDSI
jgi:hypothetical protein